MSLPRRQLVRPDRAPTSIERDRQLHRLRTKLESERTSLARWMARLKRSFNSVMKIHQRLARIERNIARLEE